MQILILLSVLLIPLACGVLIGAIQLACYRFIRRSADSTPSFPILVARGLLLFFVLAAIMAVVLHIRS